MSGNLENCQRLKPMTTAEAAQAMAKLAELATKGQPLALGLWHGTMTGTESGNVYGGEHVAVFTDDTLFAPFGPQGDQAGEAGAALLVLAARHAQDLARATRAELTPGRLAPLCRAVIDGYAAGRSALDDELLPHVVALADEAQAILDTERELQRARAALRTVLAAFDSRESRHPGRSPMQSTALRAVYDALRMRWPHEQD